MTTVNHSWTVNDFLSNIKIIFIIYIYSIHQIHNIMNFTIYPKIKSICFIETLKYLNI